jgi:putative FmdB family regulatory protein
MPLFNYHCGHCGHRFEKLLIDTTTRDQDQTCPACGRTEARREQSSRFSAGRSDSSSGGGCASGSPFS